MSEAPQTLAAPTLAAPTMPVVDRLDAVVHRCAEDTGGVVVVIWPPPWTVPWWVKILCFPYSILRWFRDERKYTYSVVGWILSEREWIRDVAGVVIYRDGYPQSRWVQKKHGPGWECGGQWFSTANLLREEGPGVAEVIVQAIDATYEAAQDLAYLAAEIEFKQQARDEILAVERKA